MSLITFIGTYPNDHFLKPDMIFVQKFTQPDFQAKSFTPQKCVICDFFLAKQQRKCIKYQSFRYFLVIYGVISSMPTVSEMESG